MKRIKRITVDHIMSWRPCKPYTRARVKEIWNGRKYLTPYQILELGIPAEDRLWVVLHEEIIPAPQLRMLACHFAEQALLHERAAGREPDPRSWQAIKVARRYAAGEATDDELEAAARAAARAAWGAAVWEAAARAAAMVACSAAVWEAVAWEAAMWAAVAWEAAARAAVWGAREAAARGAVAWQWEVECAHLVLNWLDEREKSDNL